MKGRFIQLDSLRGLAASIVVFSHLILIISFPAMSAITSKYSPFSAFVNGRGAVIIFFILSGFVLSLPYLSGKKINYSSFLIKRFFRIYIPYIVALLIAILSYYIFNDGGIISLGNWFNSLWSSNLNLNLILNHILLIGNYDTSAFNTVIWSLIHEMRISLLFPIIGYVLLKYNWKLNLLLCCILSLISLSNELFRLDESRGYHTSYFDTLHFTSFFILGGLFAKHIEKLLSIYRRLSRGFKIILATTLIISFAYYWIPNHFLTKIGVANSGQFGDYSIAISALLLLVIAFGSEKLERLLLIKPIRFLGDISYSLYLYHIIVLLSSFYFLFGYVSKSGIITIVVLLSLVLASLSYFFVELPSIKLGKHIAQFIERGLDREKKKKIS
jgi:peptidoglycan/LPS O-acetylase OafA/YrhL